MKNSFEQGLLDMGGMMKEGYTYLINNAGKATAIITLIVSVLVTFTEVGFLGIGSTEFSSTLALLLIASYLMYFSLEDAGVRLGEESEEYLNALKRYKAAREKIAPDAITGLRAFCEAYSASEADYRRRCYLAERGLGVEEYEQYRRGEIRSKIDTRTMRAFRCADRIKRVKLTPVTLLSGEKSSARSELSGPERRRLPLAVLKLLPTTLCSLFTASIILTAKTDLSAAAVIEGLLKLAALPVVGFRGYVSGYSYATGEKALWIETKARLLEAFLESEKKTAEAH